jgi:predicted ATPase
MSVKRRVVRFRGGMIKRSEVEKRKKIELSVEAKDFGPISGGKITLKPLTIFIGPNNSGKSYAAMLIHSIFESYTPSALPKAVPPFFRSGFLDIPEAHKFLSQELSTLTAQINSLEVGEELEIPNSILKKVTKKIFVELYEKRLGEEIIRSYASPLSELTRIGKKSFALKINPNSYGVHLTCQGDKLKIEEHPESDIKIKVKKSIEVEVIDVKKEKEKEYLVQIGREFREREREILLYILTDSIFEICASNLIENMAMPCYYLPAARSGILQGHKALAASIVKKSPYVGIERLEIPRFSGVVSDFISSIISLPGEKGPFYPLAEEFEKELIQGEIVVRTLDEYVYPEIKYSFHNTEIPLHRASSTVSELAPLFLYLKYTVEPGSVLIIEEPEAHLHPGNQRILAKFLVKLVRGGVNIIITTHSEYLLDQLSSFIMLSRVEPKKRVEKYGYNEEDFLKHDEVAAYVFNYDKRSRGNKITEVEITEEDGISQDEFSKIIDTLYEETIRLRRDLRGDT